MFSFATNVLASVVAGVVMLAATAALSGRARWVLTGLLGRLLDIDIDRVFADKRAADNDVQYELARAREVMIFTGRGNELQRQTFDPIFMHRPASRSLRVRVLLPQTEGPMPFDWTEQRQGELAKFDQAFTRVGILKEQIEANARFLDQYVISGKVELRRFCYPHVGRIVITDRCVYFTPYRSDAHGRESPVYKFRHGDFYDNYKRLFEQLWTAAGTVDQILQDGSKLEQ